MADPMDQVEITRRASRIANRGRPPVDYLRALVREANDIDEPRPVSTWEWVASNPGILSSRPKSPDARLASTRQQYVLDELLHAYPSPKQRESLPESVRADLDKYASDTPANGSRHWANPFFGVRGMKTDIQSPYEATGALGPGSGLRNMATWSQSLPAAAMANAENLANAVEYAGSKAFGLPHKMPYPDAPEDWRRNVATFFGPVLPTSSTSPNQSTWSAQADTRRRVDADALQNWTDMSPERRAIGLTLEGSTAEPITGQEFYAKHGLPPAAAASLGLVTDLMLDPFASAYGVFGKPAGAAAKSLAWDWGLPTALTAPTWLAEPAASDDLIDRLGREAR